MVFGGGWNNDAPATRNNGCDGGSAGVCQFSDPGLMNELLVVRGDRYQSGMHTEIGIRENSGSKSFHCAGNSESSPNFKPSPGSDLVQVSQGGHYAAPVAQAKCLELFALS